MAAPSDNNDDVYAGLKSDVDKHLAGVTANAAGTPPEGAAVPEDDVYAGLKSDVDKHLAVMAGHGVDQVAKNGPKHIDLSKLPYAKKVMRFESQGDPNAKNPASSATGAGQFEDEPWLGVISKHRPDLVQGKSREQILAMRKDPQLSEQMVDAFGNDNAETLTANGVPVSDATKYGAHRFGSSGYTKIHNADPKTPIEDIIGRHTADINRLTGKSAGDVKEMLAQNMGPDYAPPQEQDWGDTIEKAGENLLPSTGHLAAGVASSVMHPIDTFSTLKQLSTGISSKIDGYAGREQKPEQKAKDEALVDAMMNQYKEDYGSLAGFQKKLSEDPASVLFDASTLLTGGGGIVGKLPGAVGKAGEIAADVGKMVNPLNPLGAVSSGVKALTTPTAAVDKAGNITAKTDAIIKKVTGDKMSAADLVDPEVKAKFVETVGKKGVSESSVREGLLRSIGLKAPTPVVEGTAVEANIADRVKEAVGENNDKLAEHASNAAGVHLGSAGPQAGIAEALDNAHTESINKASAAYDKIRSMPGSFGPKMPEMGQFAARVKANLDKSGIPMADLQTLARTGHPQSANALKLIEDYWGKGRSLMQNRGPGDINSREILTMRKALGNLKDAASGSDIKGVSDIINAFDDHLADMSSRGLFKDANGMPLPNIGKQIKAANAGYRQHYETFENPNGVNNAVVNAVKKLKKQQGRGSWGDAMPSGDQDLYTTVEAQIKKELLHPTRGATTHNSLAKALGNKDPLSASRARHARAAHAINNAKPSLEARSQSVLKRILHNVAGHGVGALAGYEALGPVGLAVAPVAQAMYEKIADAKAARGITGGAKHTRGLLRRAAGNIARKATSPVGLATAHYTDEAQKLQRASGGRVDEDALVNQLMNRWKKAKSSSDNVTKPLLQVHDNVIAKALDIAQRNI